MPNPSPFDIPMKNSKIMQILYSLDESNRNANSCLPGQGSRIILQGSEEKMVFYRMENCKTVVVLKAKELVLVPLKTQAKLLLT